VGETTTENVLLGSHNNYCLRRIISQLKLRDNAMQRNTCLHLKINKLLSKNDKQLNLMLDESHKPNEDWSNKNSRM